MGQWKKIGFYSVLTVILLSTEYTATAQNPIDHAEGLESMPTRDINTTLKDHDEALLAIPGVVGIYVGLLPDNTTLCLKVMVIKETEELKREIPKSIEGHPVLIEESGVIRPMGR